MKVNLRTDYHKVALFAALPIAGYLGASICVDAARVDRDFKSPDPVIRGIPTPASLPSGDDPGAWFVDATGNAFTGGRLDVVKGRGVPIDLADPASAPVHPPIPNRWWLKHGIDPGFADAPQRDADRDGFSNLEEFENKTNPSDFASHPPLITKLRVADLAEEVFALKYTTHTCDGAPQAGDTYAFSYRDSAQRRNSQMGIPAGEGAASVFFADAPGHLRLELKSVRLQRVLHPRLNVMQANYVATLVDRRANKRGREYDVQKGSSEALLVRDYTATLVLAAIGESTKSFKVEENESFSLPFDEDAADKPYRFAGVREANGKPAAVIEYVEGGAAKETFLGIP